MRCIFCKELSDKSKSKEHIIPESLGNKEFILPRGAVCDKCNQYFSINIEKIVLEQPYFKYLRHCKEVESKKGIIPKIKGIIGGDVEVIREKNGDIYILVDDDLILEKMRNGEINNIIIPQYKIPSNKDRILSRFIGKIAVEALAFSFYPNDGWNEEIVDKKEIDELRNYIRFGSKPKFWEYNIRKIYNESDVFWVKNSSSKKYEILHEFNFKYSNEDELFFIVVIFGIEYVISINNPKIIGYQRWLMENNFESPIHNVNEIRKNNEDNFWFHRKIFFRKKSDYYTNDLS
jgi:hypothetical protein